MGFVWLIPTLLGVAIVIQAGMNRNMSGEIGLASTTLINNFVGVVLGVVIVLLAKAWPGSFPEFFRIKASLAHWSWWYPIPGILGCALVVGLPLAVWKIGALKVFLILMVTQILVSLFWDALVEGVPINATRAIGSLFTIVGVILISLKG